MVKREMAIVQFRTGIKIECFSRMKYRKMKIFSEGVCTYTAKLHSAETSETNETMKHAASLV